MTKKKQTKAEQLAEQDAKTQADELARIISHTCDLIDLLLVAAKPQLPADTEPIVERMQAYLDRRNITAEDPSWIAKMRKTVTSYRAQRARLRGEDMFNLD
jgi:methionyl-tRNA synthetase